MPSLIEYFESGRYKSELNPHSRTKGRMTLAFADLVHHMTRGKPNDVEIPSEIKKIVALIAPRFAGFDNMT